MAEAEVNLYGKKFDNYDPSWKGFMEKKKTRTDSRFLISLGLFFILRMGILIYAYSEGDMNRLTAVSNIAFGYILAIVLSVIYIILLRWFAKAIVYIAIILICAVLFLIICAGLFFYSTQGEKIEYLIPAISSILILIVVVCLTVAIDS